VEGVLRCIRHRYFMEHRSVRDLKKLFESKEDSSQSPPRTVKKTSSTKFLTLISKFEALSSQWSSKPKPEATLRPRAATSPPPSPEAIEPKAMAVESPLPKRWTEGDTSDDSVFESPKTDSGDVLQSGKLPFPSQEDSETSDSQRFQTEKLVEFVSLIQVDWKSMSNSEGLVMADLVATKLSNLPMTETCKFPSDEVKLKEYPSSVPMFVYPTGAPMWKTDPPLDSILQITLTLGDGRRLYGYALRVWRRCSDSLKASLREVSKKTLQKSQILIGNFKLNTGI